MAGKRFDPRRPAHELLRNARGWERLMATLPQDLTAILEQLRPGDLDVDFRIHVADGAVDRRDLAARTRRRQRRRPEVAAARRLVRLRKA